MPPYSPGGDHLTGDHDTLRERLQQALGSSYDIERELGGGGMARVFLAEERALGRRVVVKVLAPELAHDLSAERFAREIRLSARLQHPNIVPVLAAGSALGLSYYTMPFVDGESLRGRIARLVPGERLPRRDALEILRGVARALAYAHGAGVVHRDIKPDNVLLAHDAAVVADFGVAKAVAMARTGDAAASTTLTRDGLALGTPAYMSPEQAAGDPAVDHRADVYAWGILAYELLAGAHPFAGRGSVQALITAHLAEMPRPLADVVDDVPPPIAALVMRCLQKNPADRPADGGALVETLMSIGEPSGPPAVARWRRVGIAAIVALAAIGASVTWLVRGESARTTDGSGAAPVSRAAAFDAYLRGRVRVSSENREDNDAAIVALRQAIAADDSLAPAHAELARALTIKAFYFAPDSEKKPLIEDADVAVAKALALNPRLGAAHFARGLILWTPARRFPHEQAVRSYKQAIALDSTLDEAHHQLGLVYFHVGLLEESEEELQRALAINPGNTLARFRLGVVDLYRGRFERAHATFNSTPLEFSPSLWAFQMATALFRLGREREAEEMIDRFLRDYPSDEGGVGHSVRAMMLAKAGRRAGAEAAIARAIELGLGFGHFHHSAYNIASAYAMLGDRDDAIRWLQEAADDGFPCYPLFAGDAQLDGLRGDPRFTRLLAQLRRDREERKRSF